MDLHHSISSRVFDGHFNHTDTPGASPRIARFRQKEETREEIEVREPESTLRTRRHRSFGVSEATGHSYMIEYSVDEDRMSPKSKHPGGNEIVAAMVEEEGRAR